MPSRNVIRHDLPESYYHVYARGANKDIIFIDESDKDYFLYLLSRHLSKREVVTRNGYPYPHFRNKIELLTYCLMDNHFHLLFYQRDQGILSELMKSIMVSYTAYFNNKYGRTGPVFGSRFKASLVNKDSYLLHVSRYIHLNPRSWRNYKFSSFKYIRKGTEPEWLQSEKVLELHSNRRQYGIFVADYEENKKMLSELKYVLADN
ncbi:transposase [Candidatus Saccharibacteria bacterium]|nr:transposase [Candidatus Saccharibacteria bacterium]